MFFLKYDLFYKSQQCCVRLEAQIAMGTAFKAYYHHLKKKKKKRHLSGKPSCAAVYYSG